MATDIHQLLKPACYLALSGVMVLSACSRQLDLAPEDTLVEREVFRNRNSTEQALSECYYYLFQAMTSTLAGTYGDVTTSNLQHTVSYDNYYNGTVDPADESVQTLWQSYYKAINPANNLVMKVPLYAAYDTAAQRQFIAEARFIRAFAYLDLLKFFGSGALTGQPDGPGVPLQLTPFEGYNTGDVIPRSTNSAVYTQIVKDLQEAIPALPEKFTEDVKTRARATKGSALALLSRAYLYQRRYAEAAAAAQQALGITSVYSLTSSLRQLFPDNPDGAVQAMTPEYIFGFPVSAMTSSSSYTNNNLGYTYYYKYSLWIDPGFVSLFENGDLRVSQLMYKGDTVYNADQRNSLTTFKFNNRNGRDNVPVIRLAEVMLTAAEALARTSGVIPEAVSLLNQVRSRSLPNATPYTVNDFANADALVSSILRQRRFELAFEGFYRYDLIRTGQPLHTPDIPDNMKVLPVPQIEISVSGGVIKQNPGY